MYLRNYFFNFKKRKKERDYLNEMNATAFLGLSHIDMHMVSNNFSFREIIMNT